VWFDEHGFGLAIEESFLWSRLKAKLSPISQELAAYRYLQLKTLASFWRV